MTSLCDTCRMPGRCCSGFMLSSPVLRPMRDPVEVQAYMDELEQPTVSLERRKGHGFWRPLYWKPPTELNPDGIWRFWCAELQPDGRCGIYETRPQTCSWFEPGTDPLCAEFVGPRAPS